MSTSNRGKRSRLYWMAKQQTCQACNRRLCFEETTLDHIIPRSKGGDHSYTNLQILCGPCNVLKGDTLVLS